jgi:hypothetical protein
LSHDERWGYMRALSTLAIVVVAACGAEQFGYVGQQGSVPADGAVVSTTWAGWGGDMSNPPSGYTMTYGAWGTDAEYNTTTYTESGSSVEFKSTTPAAGKTELLSDKFTTYPGQPWSVHGKVRASSVTAGNNVYMQVIWYGRTNSLLSTSDAYAAAVLAAADTWYEVGSIVTAPASAAYGRARFGKVNGGGFTVYWNTIDAVPMPRCARAYLNSNDTSVTTLDEIPLTHETYDYGDVFDNATYYAIIIPCDGVYAIKASALVGGLSAGEYAAIDLIYSGTGVPVSYGPLMIVPAGSSSVHAAVSYEGFLARGSRIAFRVAHNHASAATVYGATIYTWMTITEIRG